MIGFSDRLRKISDNLGEISGTNTPRVDEVFTADFMAKHSTVPDIATFFREAGIDASPGMFERVTAEELDTAAARLTAFPTWSAMIGAAGAAWAASRLFAK